jgi:hypothetical protein
MASKSGDVCVTMFTIFPFSLLRKLAQVNNSALLLHADGHRQFSHPLKRVFTRFPLAILDFARGIVTLFALCGHRVENILSCNLVLAAV